MRPSARPTSPAGRAKRKRFLDADQAKLYELIWLRTVASQMESAELERTTVDIDAKVASRLLDLRATGTVGEIRRLPHALSGRPGRRSRGRRSAPAAADERGRTARQALDHSRPAFHRAAAALLRSVAGQAHGRTRHRPAVDLCLHPAGAQGPQICADRQAAAGSGRPRPHRRRLPGKFLCPIRRVRFYRGPRGAARSHLQQRGGVARGVARFLARFHRRHRRDQGFENLRRSSMRSMRCWRSICSRRATDGGDPRVCPTCGNGTAVAQAEQVRRLHRLLELSRMPLYPVARRAGGRRGRDRHQEARRGSGRPAST